MNDTEHNPLRPRADETKPDRQPREQPVACQLCGFDLRMRPRRMTWNPSALCDGCEGVELRRAATGRLVEQGYGPQVAEQIVDKLRPATWPVSR